MLAEGRRLRLLGLACGREARVGLRAARERERERARRVEELRARLCAQCVCGRPASPEGGMFARSGELGAGCLLEAPSPGSEPSRPEAELA